MNHPFFQGLYMKNQTSESVSHKLSICILCELICTITAINNHWHVTRSSTMYSTCSAFSIYFNGVCKHQLSLFIEGIKLTYNLITMTNILKQFPNLVPLDLQTSLPYWDILDPNILLLSKDEVFTRNTIFADVPSP